MVPYPTPNMQSFIASADLSAKQFHFVKLGTADQTVSAIAAVTDKPIGILMNAPLSGEAAEVAMIGGGAKLKAGGVIAVGDRVGASSAGKGLACDSVTGEVAVAVALDGAAEDDVVPVVIMGLSPRKAAVVAFSAGSNLVGVDGAASNAAPLAGTETRLDALDTAVGAILTALKNAGVMASA
jgi:hypothetical protein